MRQKFLRLAVVIGAYFVLLPSPWFGAAQGPTYEQCMEGGECTDAAEAMCADRGGVQLACCCENYLWHPEHPECYAACNDEPGLPSCGDYNNPPYVYCDL